MEAKQQDELAILKECAVLLIKIYGDIGRIGVKSAVENNYKMMTDILADYFVHYSKKDCEQE